MQRNPYPPEMQEARDRIFAACRKYGVAFLEGASAENIAAKIDEGVRVIAGQAAGRGQQVLAADVHRDVGGRAGEAVEQQARLAAGAAAVLDQDAARAEPGGHVGGVGLEDGQLAARGIILGQVANLLE